MTAHSLKLTRPGEVWCAKDKTKVIHMLMSFGGQLRTIGNSFFLSSSPSDPPLLTQKSSLCGFEKRTTVQRREGGSESGISGILQDGT